MNDALLTIIKIGLTVLILPIVWACGVVFHGHIVSLPGSSGDFFLWGMFGFLMLFLFFYQFWGVYEFGQKITTGMFQFTFPVGKILVLIVPFYLTAILLLYYVLANLLGVKVVDHYFMFFAGFAFTMHILLTAQEMQQQEKTFIKPTYLFMIGIVTILMVFVTVLLFDLVFGKFMFPKFFETVSSEAWSNYARIGNVIVFGK